MRNWLRHHLTLQGEQDNAEAIYNLDAMRAAIAAFRERIEDDSTIARRAELLLEFLRDGAVVGRSNTVLPPPDDKGRIPYVATIPSDRFSPGRVELRATLRRGPYLSAASTFFSAPAISTPNTSDVT